MRRLQALTNRCMLVLRILAGCWPDVGDSQLLLELSISFSHLLCSDFSLKSMKCGHGLQVSQNCHAAGLGIRSWRKRITIKPCGLSNDK